MLQQSHKRSLFFLCFLLGTPKLFAEDSDIATFLKYGSGVLLIGITCGVLLKKSRKNIPNKSEPQNITTPIIRNYMQLNHPVVQVLRCFIAKDKGNIKEINLNVIHPYNDILDRNALEEDLTTGLSLSSSITVTILQEANEDSYASYEINALRNYLANYYPHYTCLDISKDYKGITLTLKATKAIDCQAIEKELRAALAMPNSVDLSVCQLDAELAIPETSLS